MPEVFGRVGLSAYAEQTAMVMEMIKERKKISKGDIQRQLYRDVDERTLEIVLSTLQISMFIKELVNTETGRTVYEWLG
jgi:tRNA U54 and U55 pseudouridine synthase Pus10